MVLNPYQSPQTKPERPAPGPCFTVPSPSECIARARRKLCLKLDRELGAPLRSMMFAAKTGGKGAAWCYLKDSVSRKAAGEVSYYEVRGKAEPVQAYVVVRLWSGLFLEAVRFTDSCQELQFYSGGIVIGRMLEMELPKPASWWRRLILKKSLWRVFLHDKMIGTIEVNYPVTKKTRVFLRLDDSYLCRLA